MIIVIAGPTGVGKTKLSIELAKKLNGEIINADSTQIFKELNIATAKVTNKEMENVPHHLIDIKEITENYTVYDYQKDARKKIKEIEARGHIPILVGGTGLYIKAALYDYEFQEETNHKTDYSNFTKEELYEELLKVDPNTEIHMNNRKRVERALDYFKENHQPFSSKEHTNQLLYDTIFIGLTTDREILYERINTRVEEMLKQGLLEEAKKIYQSMIRTKAVMTPIGYKELFEYFDGNCILEDSIHCIQQRSRNYAKRQYTWFNHQLPMKWFDVNFKDFNKTIHEVVKYIEEVK
jgi:tRNA dimethylallyltransferase